VGACHCATDDRVGWADGSTSTRSQSVNHSVVVYIFYRVRRVGNELRPKIPCFFNLGRFARRNDRPGVSAEGLGVRELK
jgi:hypothetical protein